MDIFWLAWFACVVLVVVLFLENLMEGRRWRRGQGKWIATYADEVHRWRNSEAARLTAEWGKLHDERNALAHAKIDLARRERALDGMDTLNKAFGFGPAQPSQPIPPLGPNPHPTQVPDGMEPGDSELNEPFGYLAPPQYPPYPPYVPEPLYSSRPTQPLRPFETQESRELFANSIRDFLRTQRTGDTEGEADA